MSLEPSQESSQKSSQKSSQESSQKSSQKPSQKSSQKSSQPYDTVQTRDWSWPFWYLLPLYPYSQRRTLRHEVIAGQIWTFEQSQGILYTVVPIRMTIVKLAAGGLLVYAPIAPTQECIRLVRELEATAGDVRYIILPTVSGLEHKIFVGPFARCFPQAQVYVAPNQWSFPLNLPLNWLGFPAKRTHILPSDSRQAPFADEFDYATLHIDLGRGSFGEVALYHKRSHTLLVTDTVLSVPAEPPAIVQLDPYPLLFHARESAVDKMVDTAANRRKGWERIALFALYFQPSAVETRSLKALIREAFQSPDRSKKAYFGLFPFQWRSDWQRSFAALRSDGRLFVAPVLQLLILDHAPQAVMAWVDRVASWQFQRIIAAHFAAPVIATPDQFRQVFAVLQSSEQHPVFGNEKHPLPAVDVELILKLEKNLDRWGITVPPNVRSGQTKT